ncbi:MAG: PSD1 and planctomycete cytochrome C domain-containing protein [Chthoniobacter sp.]|nr:PSD1 and planctomycete cytochrome C domain-containing protein [Chthoniobacter sp.]
MNRLALFLSLLPLAAIAADVPSTSNLTADQTDYFNRNVLPVLKQRCYECHSHDAKKIKGGLVVDSREGLLKGGDTGPAVVPHNLKDSLIIDSVRWNDPDFQMPPKEKLPEAEIKMFEEWVQMGAPDPRNSPAGLGNQQAIAAKAREHWAFKPVQDPAVPEVKNKAWPKTPVDNFLLAKLEAKGMKPSAPTDRQTLIRRVTYDLTGLPPTPEETRAFIDDKSPDAYARLVDRLLASPHYGERWARYWLDVARYADTTGSAGVGGKDNRFIYAWTYRDYVVRAFNEDKPYNQFIVEQLAADRLVAKKQTDQRNLAALGFLTVGKRFTNPDDEIDDRIDATARAFLGMTVTCARCHDHKFEPIPTEDYYSWHGIFSSTTEPELGPLLEEPKATPEYQDFEKKITDAQGKVTELVDNEWEGYFDEHFAKMGQYLFAIEEAKKGLGGLSVSAFYLTRGLRPTIAQRLDAYLKGDAARGAAASAKTTKAPKFDPIFAPWKAFAALPAAEFEAKAPELAKKFAGTTEPAEPTTAATGEGVPAAPSGEEKVNPLVAKLFEGEPPKTLKEVADRYGALFTNIQKEHHEKRDALLKAAGHWQPVEVKFDDPAAEALQLALYGTDSPVSREKLTFRAELGVNVSGKMERQVALINDIRLNHPASPARALAIEDLPKPRNSHVFIRGDRNKQGPEVPHRFLTILGGSNAKPFPEGSGRLELGQAIASQDNPLTPRVIVNRVWMYHFGQGLVGTPSDFGLRGDTPTHPELLDYLARQFMEGGWSLKKLHRLIVLSAAYQQRSEDVPKYRETDPTNTLVWKMNRRRLDVEAMRDTLLSDAGTLDLKIGGKPVEILGDEPRRTIYANINRENVPGFLANFDFALPEMSSPMRNESVVPTQALFLMNSPFVIEQARKLAALPEIEHAANDEARVRQFYQRLFQRPPSKEDLADALAFLHQQAAYKPEPPPKSDWKFGAGIPTTPEKPLYFAEAKAFRFNEWVSYEKGGAQVRVSDTGGLTGPTAASIRRWIAPVDGIVRIEGTLMTVTAKSAAGVHAKVELRHGNEAPRELFAWKALKEGVATNIEQIEVKRGDALDFVALPSGKVAESYVWAPSVHLLNVPGDMPEKHDWDAHSEFAGPPPPPPKGMTAWEKYAQSLLLTNELVYVN